MDATQPLTGREFEHAGGTQDWRVLSRGAAAWFQAPTHRAGAALVRRASALALQHGTPHPDMKLRASGVQVRLARGEKGFEPVMVDLAGAISAAAAELGLRPDRTVVQDLQLTLDTLDREAVIPFWEAALGYQREGDEDVVDPERRRAPIWFQQQDAPRPLRNRLHLDVVTTPQVAAAALEAVRLRGARSVAEHGYYATVADAEGNEVDLLPLQEGADRWGGLETEDWRLVFAAVACYPVHDVRRAVELAEAVAALADDAGLPLGVDLRPGQVTIDTGKDVWEQDPGYEPLAARVQEAARALDLTADVDRSRFVQVGIDAVDVEAVRRFWRTALGYVEDPRPGVTDVVDPRQLGMPLFFQPMEADDVARRAQRNRFHVDLYVPSDQAEARVAAALAAGGRITYDAEAPEWWTLADPEGNEVDIAVTVGREEHWRALGAS